MNTLKPVVSIRLVPNVKCSTVHDIWAGGRRVDGYDYWEVTVTITTTENHVTQHKFISSTKTKALSKAYIWLRQNSIRKWFPTWEKDACLKYSMLLDDERRLRVFTAKITAVSNGELDPDDFIVDWDKRLARFFTTDKVVIKRAEDTHATRKWSFWDWFRDTDNSNNEYK